MSDGGSSRWEGVRNTIDIFANIASIISFISGLTIGGGTTVVIGELSRLGMILVFLILSLFSVVGLFSFIIYISYKERRHQRENRKF